jgi:hypothetical protein
MEAQYSTEKNRVKEALEKERARQIALVAMAQEQTIGVQTNPMIHPTDDERGRAAVKGDAQQTKKTPKDASPKINKNNSGVSLDYSIDSASFLGGDGSTIAGSSLLGGRFATDGSVATAASTKGAWANALKKQDPLVSTNEHAPNARDDDEVSGFSLQESTSSMEAVPSDEELFAVGWAKALDPKSGSYYFFTLDRTQTVWDNPLASRGASVDSTETGSLPPGSAVI